ncbi:MAG: FapA family protein [Desulforhopalus sp.]
MDKKIPDQNKNRKILEPTYHFTSQLIKIGEDYTTDKITVSELVTAGKLLADFPNFHRFAARGFEKAVLEPGDYAQFSEDESAIIATAPGYPKLKKIRRPDCPDFVTILSVEPLFLVSPDKMKVSLVIHPPLENAHSLIDEDIEKLLAEESINFGINSDALASARSFIAKKEKEFRKFVIACGQPVGESKDAYLRYDMEIGPIAGTLLDNGNIDFRDRRIMVGVSSGQCIATKFLPVQGEPGINVYGEETAAREGKDIKVEVLNDARYSSETMQVTATKDGVLSIVNNNIIKVLSHKVISSDVDYATGNVESMNAITIIGSVQPGFYVKTGGDLKITGSVMSASSFCDGNLVVLGGTTGKNSTLQTKGDADINFIEQGTLKCGGITVIRKQAYYSDISAGSDIRCHNLCVVMGGRLIAEGNITLGSVGSENSTPALIAAGTVFERIKHLQQLKSSVIEQQDAIIMWLQKYRGSSKSKKVRQMEKQLAETKLLLLRLNLIPGTGIYSRVGAPDEDAGVEMKSDDYTSEGGIPIENITIDVVGTIFAGTIIRIGNHTMKLDKTVSNRQFRLHANGKRIIAGPIKR